MNQYLLKISYDGSNYYGWAKQPGSIPTIQGTIEKVCQEIFDKKINVFASGRTDRYVHAISLPVLLRGDDSLSTKKVIKKLNKKLPNDIRVHEIQLVDKKFQVRFDTKGKKYKYIIKLNSNEKSHYWMPYNYEFDFEKFINSTKKFIGEKNFASFTGKEKYHSYVRKINDIQVYINGDFLIVDIIGEGFMRYMVRNIIGTLLTYNRNKITNQEFDDLFKNPLKGKSHYKAPGSGLYLVEVYY
ncbi:MAG: tRNA pseudouridine synthase A [Candidatus Tyloplasma litorale]|nr:MAG: tRNA pseudouridine synthase A [Mycoplasmatales bacterium]